MGYFMNPDMDDVMKMMCEVIERGFTIIDEKGKRLSYDRESGSYTVQEVDGGCSKYETDEDNFEEEDFETSTAQKAINHFCGKE